jgi:hypothetical protein
MRIILVILFCSLPIAFGQLPPRVMQDMQKAYASLPVSGSVSKSFYVVGHSFGKGLFPSTLAITNTSGNTLIVFLGSYSSASRTNLTISDSLVNSYTKITNVIQWFAGASTNYIYAWQANNIASGSNRVTISAAGSYDVIDLIELPPMAYDSVGVSSGVKSNTITTSSKAMLLSAMYDSQNGFGNTTTLNPGNAASSLLILDNTGAFRSESWTNSGAGLSAGTYMITNNYSGSAQYWLSILIGLK